MKGSDFIFDSVQMPKNNLNLGRSCIYIATAKLNDEAIGKIPERISKSKSFINKYNWKGINYPTGKDD